MPMNFETALARLKAGAKMTRIEWGAIDQFAFLIPGSTFQVNRHPLLGIYPIGTTIHYRPHIAIVMPDNTVAELALTHSDVLAEDWVEIVE